MIFMFLPTQMNSTTNHSQTRVREIVRKRKKNQFYRCKPRIRPKKSTNRKPKFSIMEYFHVYNKAYFGSVG